LTLARETFIVLLSKAKLEKSSDAKLQGPSQDGSQLPGTKKQTIFVGNLASIVFCSLGLVD
jgi:hypothetical protein